MLSDLFTWAELTPAARAAAYAEWQQGKGLIGGDPRLRPGSHLLPTWGLDQPFFRALALEDARAGAFYQQSRDSRVGWSW